MPHLYTIRWALFCGCVLSLTACIADSLDPFSSSAQSQTDDDDDPYNGGDINDGSSASKVKCGPRTSREKSFLALPEAYRGVLLGSYDEDGIPGFRFDGGLVVRQGWTFEQLVNAFSARAKRAGEHLFTEEHIEDGISEFRSVVEPGYCLGVGYQAPKITYPYGYEHEAYPYFDTVYYYVETGCRSHDKAGWVELMNQDVPRQFSAQCGDGLCNQWVKVECNCN